jgi:predicted dehydrogenase
MGMRIAIVGCGFVAEYYIKTLFGYPELELVGCMDCDQDRAAKFSTYYSVPAYHSLKELLQYSNAEIILNLTNPRSHYEISKLCLEAGKHVYSEKPLAMEMLQAEELVKLAEQKGLQISSAPCSLLSETAQTIWKALREKIVGKVRLVYAEMDDGLVHKLAYKHWLNESGTPWPYKDEFEVGCTLEHAGYYGTWLTAFFGPAETVTAFSSCLIPDKETGITLEPSNSPDFSVACIKFTSGVVARLTCSIVAPHDHRLRIIGDDGNLEIEDCWYYDSPVFIRRMLRIRGRIFVNPFKQRYPLVKKPPKFGYKSSHRMDFCRGVAEMATAIIEKRTCRLSPHFCLHNNELVLAIHNALETGAPVKLSSTFDPIQPMWWAEF